MRGVRCRRTVLSVLTEPLRSVTKLERRNAAQRAAGACARRRTACLRRGALLPSLAEVVGRGSADCRKSAAGVSANA
eukprot:6173451-Pleurochrysis_carterae.AAC.1